MAESQTTDRETAKAIQQHIGDGFLVNTVHVARDKKGGKPGEKEVKSIPGGRLVSDLEKEEKLTADEIEEFEREGAIRPASVDDIRASQARAATREAAQTERERKQAFASLDAEQGAERQKVIDKHNAARDKELTTLAEGHAKDRAKLEKEYAPAPAK